ncbi:hypothetical protein T08_6855 [Trichinella sp. T8]|nr:hypothetical protein T08_6855 [Trichinella sp. T8]
MCSAILCIKTEEHFHILCLLATIQQASEDVNS